MSSRREQRFKMGLLAVALGATMSAAFSADARDIAVDVELVLAVDVSWSMDLDEQMFQRQGYIEAITHSDVIRAIRSGFIGAIAVTYVEWAGADIQSIIVPWMLIDSPASAEAFGARISRGTIGRRHRTSISGAIAYSSGLFRDNGFEGARQVIDISGDGPNNQGVPVTLARDIAVNDGIIINGLPIMLKPREFAGFYNIANLDAYYEDCVIGGFGAFVIPVRSRDEWIPAIRRKLILEVASAHPHAIPAQARMPGESRMDCLIGEKLWEDRMRYLE